MTRDELIMAAQDAIGGLERLRAIRTYHAVLRRMRDDDGALSTVSVWRAAGGRIRIEERSVDDVAVRVANGPGGTIGAPERAELLRDARIAPRNLLAHAAEHHLALRARPAPDGSHIVSFPAEFVLYFFHPTTFLCARMIDLVRHRQVEFRNYRLVDGVRTSFAEHHVSAGGRGFRDAYVRVAYNLELEDGLFEPDVGAAP